MLDIGPGTETAAMALAITYLAKTVYEVVLRQKGSRNGNGNGSSGDKSVEFWKAEIHGSSEMAVEAAFEAKLKPALENQTRILVEIREGQAETNRGMTELITVMRERKGRIR